MTSWLKDHLIAAFGVKEAHAVAVQIKMARYKPPAFLTIDDRAIQFTGIFPDPKDLLDFVPWNKQ